MILRAIEAIMMIMTCLILSRPKNWRISLFLKKRSVFIRFKYDVDVYHESKKDKRNIPEILTSISNQFADACAQ